MKKLFTFAGLAVLSLVCLFPSHAEARTSSQNQARAARKTQKKQQKAMKKYIKQQQKAQRKMVKYDRKHSHRTTTHY
jgi:hypothetical protein